MARRRVTHLAKARAHARTATALIEKAMVASARCDRRQELHCSSGAKLQLRACRVELDKLEYEIEHSASPTRAGGGDASGPEAA